MSNRLLSFESEQARRGAYARTDRGLQTVELGRIVGSVGRAAVLDRRFRPRRGWRFSTPVSSEMRTRRMRRLFECEAVPPLELYRIGDDLFVVDGHHRACVAHERGQQFVEARVVEYQPDRADPTNAVYYERLAFTTATGLDGVHAAEPGRYPRLLNRVRDYARELTAAHRELALEAMFGRAALAQPLPMPPIAGPPDLREAARDWYQHEYRPVVDVLAAERVGDSFPGRATGDLYGYVCDHRWYLSEQRGWDVGVDAALADFARRHAPEPLADALVDPIVALGSELLDGESADWRAQPWVAFLAGLAALPLAFLRGLRPQHYRFARLSPDEPFEHRSAIG